MAIDLKIYEAMLQRLDWYFQYADDHSVWSKGNQAMQQAIRNSTESPEHKQLFEIYRAINRKEN